MTSVISHAAPIPTVDFNEHTKYRDAIRRMSEISASGLLVFLATTLGAAAQDAAVTAAPAPFYGTGLRVDLGLGVAVAPGYEGSRTYRASPFPFASIGGLLYDRVSISADRGVAVNVVALDHLKAGLAIGYSSGRNRHDGNRVNGLPEISGAMTLAGFLTYDLKPFSVGLAVKDRLGPDSGTVISLDGTYRFHPLPKLQMSVGPKVNFADRQYEQTFFGVSPGAAARATALGNPMRAYSATPGIKNVELVLTAKYAISEHWSAAARVGLSELVGSAANSPLTQRKFEPSAAAGLIYRF